MRPGRGGGSCFVNIIVPYDESAIIHTYYLEQRKTAETATDPLMNDVEQNIKREFPSEKLLILELYYVTRPMCYLELGEAGGWSKRERKREIGQHVRII